MKRNKLFLGLTAAAASLCLAFGFAACAGDDDSDSSNGTESTTASNADGDNGNNSDTSGNGNNGANGDGTGNGDSTGGNGGGSAEGALAAPTGLTAEAAGSDSVDLLWNAVDGADIYQIAWGASSNAKTPYGYTQETYATIENLEAGTRYYFWVRAGSGDDEVTWSAWSAYARVTTNADDDSGTPATPTVDNSVLANVEKVDAYYVPQLVSELTADEKGIKLRVVWSETAEYGYDHVAPNVVNFYRSTTLTNDFSAYQKIGSHAYNSSSYVCYIEDYDVQFNAGDKYYYIAVAADAEDSATGTWSKYMNKWVLGDTAKIRWYYPATKKTTKFCCVDDDYDEYVFTSSSKYTDFQAVSPALHTIEWSDDEVSWLTIKSDYQFYAGFEHTVNLSTKEITRKAVTGIPSSEKLN